MRIHAILVEGKSALTYLRDTLKWAAPDLATLRTKIEDGGGYTEIEAKLVAASQTGEADHTVVVWDQDILDRPGQVPALALVNHPHSYTLPRDFEALFPPWMVEEALKEHDPARSCPSYAQLWHAVHDGSVPPYKGLEQCLEAHARATSPQVAVSFPSKTQLSEALARVAQRFMYQPEDVRRFIGYLRSQCGMSSTIEEMISDPADSFGFRLNSSLIDLWKLRGRLAFKCGRDVYVADITNKTLELVAANQAAGPPCWSANGEKIAFPCLTKESIPNSECVRVLDATGRQPPKEIRRIGHYLCWDRAGWLYGNHLGAGGYLVVGVNVESGERRVLPLESGAIVACIDRQRSRMLVGEQGRREGRVCSIFRINDGERVWDGAAAGIPLAEYSAPAFAPDGRQISWPIENVPGVQAGGLWITRVGGAPRNIRITPPEGDVQTSTWAPEGNVVAFMWSRWSGDPVRLWVATVAGPQLCPLIEGRFGGEDFTALGCHSWDDFIRS